MKEAESWSKVILRVYEQIEKKNLFRRKAKIVAAVWGTELIQSLDLQF